MAPEEALFPSTQPRSQSALSLHASHGLGQSVLKEIVFRQHQEIPENISFEENVLLEF